MITLQLTPEQATLLTESLSWSEQAAERTLARHSTPRLVERYENIKAMQGALDDAKAAWYVK